MICPWCEADLLQRERTGRRCSKCRREFALDPKTNALLLHDLRLRRLTAALTDSGRHVYTADQLRYAAARKPLSQLGARVGPVFLFFFSVVTGCMTIASVMAGPYVVTAVAGFLSLSFVTSAIMILRRPRLVSPPMTDAEFRHEVVDRWRTIYGSPPPGLMDEARLPAYVPPPSPCLALLCDSRTVLQCLLVNRAHETYGVALAFTVAELPAGVPVAVLHDASPAGCAFFARARAAMPGRSVVDLGIRPRSVMRGNAVRLRGKPLPVLMAGKLRSSGMLSNGEVDWLCEGWWSPVAAVRPAALLTVVASAADRVASAGDPDRVNARNIGFITWPMQ